MAKDTEWDLGDRETTRIGGYDIRTRIDHIGPIVWTDVTMGPDGGRRTQFNNPTVEPLASELTPPQANELTADIFGMLLHEDLLPEVRRRFGAAVTERDFVDSPEWQARLQEMLIVVPAEGQAIVYLNEEVGTAQVPAGCGSVWVRRRGFKWQMRVDWLPLFPSPIPTQVHAAVEQMATAILSGDEEKATALARAWFPSIWEASPKSLRDQLGKEVYVLLFGISQREAGNFVPGNDPEKAIMTHFASVAEALEWDYTLEGIRQDAAERSQADLRRFDEAEAGMASLFKRAGLSRRELLVMRLEAVLALRDDAWSELDKAKHLGIREGRYREALHSARVKLEGARAPNVGPHLRLLRAIFMQGA